jgi:hypothetical protein
MGVRAFSVTKLSGPDLFGPVHWDINKGTSAAIRIAVFFICI